MTETSKNQVVNHPQRLVSLSEAFGKLEQMRREIQRIADYAMAGALARLTDRDIAVLMAAGYFSEHDLRLLKSARPEIIDKARIRI